MFVSVRFFLAALLCSLVVLISFTSVAECAHQLNDGQRISKRGMNGEMNVKRRQTCNPCCPDCPVQMACDPSNPCMT